MKILFCIDTLASGGKERRLVELLKGLESEPSIECELIVMSDIVHYQEIYDLNIKVHSLIRKTKKDFGIFLRLFKKVKSIQPDIIQSHSSMISVYLCPIVKILKIPFINAIISTAPIKVPFSLKWRMWLTFKFSTIIVSNTRRGIKSFNAPGAKSVCIHNGFDFKRVENLLEKKQVFEKFDIDKNDIVIGMVANTSSHKDYDTFIKVGRAMLSKNRSLTFLAVGGGFSENLKKYSEEVKDEEKIKFLGVQSDVESIINIFTIGLLFSDSSVHGEGISNSIVEYMALGKPVIANDNGGNREIIVNGKSGYLVKDKDVEKIIELIQLLLDDEDKRISFGAFGFERIHDTFGIERMVNSYKELYRNCKREAQN